MNVMEKLENYFNSGSTDKQNKRRLGGLLIAITAILLVVAIITVSVGGAIMAIVGIVDGFKNPGNDDDGGNVGNSHLVETTPEDITIKANATKFTLTNGEVALTEADYKTFSPVNRPEKDENDANTKDYLYRAHSPESFALQNEAFEAFNAMVRDFYAKTGLDTLWIRMAYNKDGGNVSYFTNGLAVKLEYTTDYAESAGSIYGVDDYKWIYEHAHEYGFVSVSNLEGEENILRYVGLAHAKYIESKQGKNDEDFYGLDDYLAEITSTTPDNTMKVSSVKKAIGDKSTTTYYTYFMSATATPLRLPNSNKYNATVLFVGDGYIVTYCKADK